MKLIKINKLLFSFTIFLSFSQINAQEWKKDSQKKERAEIILKELDIQKLKFELQEKTGITDENLNLFFETKSSFIHEFQQEIFEQIILSKFSKKNIPKSYSDLLNYLISDLEKFDFSKSTANSKDPKIETAILKTIGCNNVDFENGTTSGWNGFAGTASTSPNPSGLTLSFTRINIMTGSGFDNLLGGNILPVVAPGGNFSVRLENQSNGADASRLSQTFLIDSSNASFTYKFATVLEDGSHSISEQAYFKVRVLDGNGNVINCFTDSYTPTSPYTGLTYYSGLYYKAWTSRTILLGNYIGQNVTIEFTAQDCTQTGHLGYGYIDGACLPLQITASSLVVCPGIGINLSAPSGYTSYSWSGPGIVGSSTTQNIVANQPGNYQVNVTSGNCTSPVFITLTGGGIESTTAQLCSGDTTILQAPIGFSTYAWSGPGIIGATDTSFVLVDEPGTYNLAITGGTGSLCSSIFFLDSLISPHAGVDLNICSGDTVQLNVTGGSTSFHWFPNTQMIDSITANPSVYPTITTNYIATTCGVKDTIIVNVISAITASTTGDVINCNRNGVPIGINVSGNGDYNYSWSPTTHLDQVNTSSVIASPLQTSVYYVTVSLGNNCVYLDSIKITVLLIASFEANPIQDSICLGAAVQLNAIYQKDCGLNNTVCNGILTPVQLGAAITNSSITNTTVYNGTNFSSKFQILVTKAELNALGIFNANTLTDFGFNIFAVSGSNIYQNFSIKMNCTNETVLTTNFNQNLLEVFSPKNVILSLGVNYYNFDNTFDWDGSTNLIFEICYLNSALSSNSSISYTNGTISSFLAKSSVSACNETVGVLNTNRPNLYFKFCATPPLSAVTYSWSPALGLNDDEIANPTANPLVSTNYIVTAVDTLSSCIFTDSVKLIVGNTFNVSLADSILSCNLLGVTLDPIISTVGNYSYSWLPNSFLSSAIIEKPIASPLSPTKYKVTITNEDGCSIKDSIKVNVANLATFYVTPNSDSICMGQNVQLTSFYQKGCGVNGSLCSGISTTAQVGTATTQSSANSSTIYRGSSNGSKTQILFKNTELIAAGIVTGTTLSHIGFNIASVVGNNIYQNFSIKMSCTSLTTLSTTFEVNLQTVFSPKNVILSNGINYYTFDNNFDWDGTSNLIVEICYYNASTSSNSTSYYSSTTFTSVNYTTGNLVCGSLSGLNSTFRPNTYFKYCAASPNGSLDFQWSPSIGLNNDSISNPLASPIANVNYTVTATDTSNGCVFTEIVSIHTSQNKILNLGNDSTICNGASFSLNAKSGFDTYLWNDGTTDSIRNITNTGLYWVRVANSCGTQTDTCRITTNNDLSNFSLGNDTIICRGISFNLNAYNPNFYSYIWQDASNDSVVSVLDSGLYWLRISDQCGSKIDSIYISLDSILPINLGNDTVLCPSNTIVLNIRNNYNSIVWSTGSINDSIVVNSVGIYSVIATNNCGNVKDTLRVSYEINPQISIGNDTLICTNTSLNLDAEGCSSCSYLWQDNSTNSNFSANIAGVYHVTATNFCGFVRDSITISTSNPAQFNLGNDTVICNSNTLILDPGTEYLSYDWNDGSSAQTNEISSPGGEIILRAFNACGEFFDTINVNFKYLPTVDLGLDTVVCENQSIQLNANTCINCSYLWQDGSVDSIFIADTLGIFFVRITNDCGFQIDTINVNLSNDKPIVDLGSDISICENDREYISTNYNPNYTYLWHDGSNLSETIVDEIGTFWVRVTNGCVSNSDTLRVLSLYPSPALDLGNDTTICQNAFLTLMQENNQLINYWSNASAGDSLRISYQGTYWLRVTNLYDCQTTDTIKVYDKLLPYANLGGDLQPCLGNNILLEIQNPSYTYVWSNASTENAINVNETGTYTVYVSNECGTFVEKINIDFQNCECSIDIPSAFSPNKDLHNDILFVRGNCITDLNLYIYNRWGEMVFESHDVLLGWDGTYNSQDLTNDIFYYVIDAKVDGKSITKEGSISLVK